MKKKKENKHSLKKVFANNWFIIKYTFKVTPFYTLGLCLHTMLHSFVIFVQHIYLISFVLSSFEAGKPFEEVLIFIAVIAGLEIVRQFIFELYDETLHPKHKQKLHKIIQYDIYNKAVALDLASYDDPTFFNDYVWALNDAKHRVDNVIEVLTKMSGTLTYMVLSGIFVVTNDPLALIFVAVSFVGTYLINLKINKKEYNLNMELRPMERKRDYFSRIFYLKNYAKEIRLFNIKNKLLKDYDQTNSILINTVRRRTKSIAILSFIASFFLSLFLFNGLFIAYLIYKVIVLKAFSYGVMVGLVRTSLMLNDTLGDLARTVPKFRDNSMYIEKIRGFLSHNADIVSGDRAIETTKQSPLVLSNVSFSYDKTKDSRILEDINITVNPGEKIAIVGHNGAGKTTLVNLILRLYDVTDGEIQYDGTNIKDYELKDYRNMFGTVFQDYELFATSIANNVVMDADGVNHSDEVIAVLKKSGFGQKLEALEHGINTELTKEFDSKGTELSGGESQKIAIARALYKNSKILILDEPSSALDPISEYHFNKTMTESLEDKTIIFISHRLSTTKMADKIFLLENGKIIEQGNHDTLMKLNGQYARMFNLQAERYRTNAAELAGAKTATTEPAL